MKMHIYLFLYFYLVPGILMTRDVFMNGKSVEMNSPVSWLAKIKSKLTKTENTRPKDRKSNGTEKGKVNKRPSP